MNPRTLLAAVAAAMLTAGAFTETSICAYAFSGRFLRCVSGDMKLSIVLVTNLAAWCGIEFGNMAVYSAAAMEKTTV